MNLPTPPASGFMKCRIAVLASALLALAAVLGPLDAHARASTLSPQVAGPTTLALRVVDAHGEAVTNAPATSRDAAAPRPARRWSRTVLRDAVSGEDSIVKLSLQRED